MLSRVYRINTRLYHAETVPMGIGPITSSALIATVGDFKQFKRYGQFGVWVGLVSKQNSSNGWARLGGIAK